MARKNALESGDITECCYLNNGVKCEIMRNLELITYLKNFDTESLAKSIYAITSWLPNRCYIGIVDNLNRILHEIENEKGKVKINTYSDFQNLFIKIKKHMDDLLIYKEDFTSDSGEVKFFSDNKFKSILIANGSEDIYEACFLIEEIVEEDVFLKSVWQEVLDYEDFIISNLYSKNYSYSNEFCCPPEAFFYATFDNFDSFKSPELKLFFQGFESENEELYGFFTPTKDYPVFLPVLKETFLEKVEEKLEYDSIKKSVWNALIKKIMNNFIYQSDRKSPYLFSIMIFDKELQTETIIEDSFTIWNGNNIVVFVSDDIDDGLLSLIRKGILDRRYAFGGLSNDRNIQGIEFKDDMNIIIQKVNTVGLSPNVSKMMMFSYGDDMYLDAKGLMGIINFANDLEEIVDFILFYKTNQDKVMNFSGITSYFQVWRDMARTINEGATEPQIVVPPYESVERTIGLFKEEMEFYPFNMSDAFSNIHFWNPIKSGKSELSLNSKSGTGSADIFKSIGKYLVYQELYFIIEDIDEKTLETITSFHEIIINGFAKHYELILSLFNKSLLEINLVSESILLKNAGNELIIETEYCKKVVINTDKNSQILLIKPYWERIFADNYSSKTMFFENNLLLSFLEGASFNCIDHLIKEFKNSDNNKRTSSISQFEVPYFIEPQFTFFPPKLSAFKSVRKLMSKIIQQIGLEPKIYDESEIVGTVRQFRNKIRTDLVEKIREFNTTELHKQLLNCYSAILFQIRVHKKRLDEFTLSNHLQDEILYTLRREAIKLREESKTYKLVLEYLIEENLICEKTSNNTPGWRQIDEMIAYAKWILDFQSMSDAVNYGAIGWNQLEIREDYVIEIEETEKYLEDGKLLMDLRYTYGDYSNRDNEIDKKMMDVIEKNFQSETGISLKSLATTLVFLYSNSIVNELSEHEEVVIKNNVVEAPINCLANVFIQETDLFVEEFYKVIEFLTINIDKIPDANGVIPIWEKKKRKNKISAQPILFIGNRMIYTPVSLYELQQSWFQGMMNFILPYNIELEKTTEAVDKWKNHYEDKIVEDLSPLFNTDIHDVYVDKELYKLDTKGNHPRDLGDYDLIVINKEKKEILLFEVKYMRLSQTMKDSLGDQSKYFLNRKAKAKQFTRRIEYFEKNAKEIMNHLGFNEEFLIKGYFLTNKNIRSFFKDYPFEVISFNQFRHIYFT